MTEKIGILTTKEIEGLKQTNLAVLTSILSVIQHGFNELNWIGEASVFQFGNNGYAVRSPKEQFVSTISPNGEITSGLLFDHERLRDTIAELAEISRNALNS